VPLTLFPALQNPVDTHADMLLLAVGDVIFAPKGYKLASPQQKIIEIDEQFGSQYPNDVLLNIAIVGKNVFCNTKFASKTVQKYLAENGFSIHHVSQGYAHCSTCIVGENALITADVGIFNAAKSIGVEALLIASGDISLPPYNYGFIGGASGLINNKIYFCGSLNYHPDGEKIRLFCQKHEKTIVELTNSPLFDVGGILFI
jgi:hypothetical protein